MRLHFDEWTSMYKYAKCKLIEFLNFFLIKKTQSHK